MIDTSLTAIEYHQTAMLWTVPDYLKAKLLQWYLKRHACQNILPKLTPPTPENNLTVTQLQYDGKSWDVCWSGSDSSFYQLTKDVARYERGNTTKDTNAYYFLSFRETPIGSRHVVIKRDRHNVFPAEVKL